MNSFFDKLAVFLATGFGSGFSPKAPGTAGSLAVLPFIFLLSFFEASLDQRILILVVLTVVGMWSTARTEHLWTSHDDKRIVIDEFAGMYLTIAWFPFDWKHVLTGFALFRLFDIWKPGPIGYIDEHGPGAWGTFFDDIVAGIFALILLYIASCVLF